MYIYSQDIWIHGFNNYALFILGFEILNLVIFKYKDIFNCNWWGKKRQESKKVPCLSLLTLLAMQNCIGQTYRLGVSACPELSGDRCW